MNGENESATRLHVYRDSRRVGALSGDESGRLAFVYDESVVGDPSAAVSVLLPVRREPYSDDLALPCFENLLPEGNLRRLLAATLNRAASDVAALLGDIGGECAGALSLWSEGSAPPRPATYRPSTAADLRDAFGPVEDPARLASTLHTRRISMSGALDKLVLYRLPAVGAPADGGPRYALPVEGAPGTVLVKRERGRYPGIVQNEVAAMSLMRAAGVPTAAHVANALDANLYESARFDRTLLPDGSVARQHAEDGCQLTARVSRAKYARTGGPAYAELIAVLARYGANPREDGELLFRWAVANIVIGNRDAHAKNLSVLHAEPMTVRLAPAYDVVCTLAYPSPGDVLALRFGGEVAVAAMTPQSLAEAAREFGLAPARAKELTADVCLSVTAALPDVLEEVERVVGPHAVLQRLDATVREVAAGVQRALLGG